MLASLKFVQGAVAKKDFVPSLTHFRIANGRVMGYNGMLSLSGPIKMDLTASPKAIPFVKAIQTCKETIALHLTPTGRLSVRSGAFKAQVDCTADEFPEVSPSGEDVPLNGSILEVLKLLEPFIADDASRPWARGILFRGQTAVATNNVIIVEKWLGYTFPTAINIPRAAVLELIRIGEEPVRIQVDAVSATFHYSGERWLRTQLFPPDWPDLSRILDVESSPIPPPDGLWQAVTDLAPFTDDLGRIYFVSNKVATTATIEESGASIELNLGVTAGCYNFKHLTLLEGVVDRIDLSSYPKACIFYGNCLRGAIVGMRG